MTVDVRRGTRSLRRLAIVLGILAILLIAADRIGAAIAENQAAKTIQSSQHLAHRPDVDISGIPFLTQLITGDFGKVTVGARDVPVASNNTTLNVSRVDVVLHGVHVSRNFSSVRADRGTATALITYPDLGRAYSATLTYLGNGRVQAHSTISALGRSYTATVSAKPVLVGQAIAFQDAQLEGASGTANTVARLLATVFKGTVPLTNFPFGVRAQQLTVDAAGVHVVLGGQDVDFSH